MVDMKVVTEMAKVTTVKQIPNTVPGRFLRPKKYEKNLDLIWKRDNYIGVRYSFLLRLHKKCDRHGCFTRLMSIVS